MKTIKQGPRLLVMVLLLILAAFGIGLTNVLNTNRERYINNETKTEQHDKREEEEPEDKMKI